MVTDDGAAQHVDEPATPIGRWPRGVQQRGREHCGHARRRQQPAAQQGLQPVQRALRGEGDVTVTNHLAPGTGRVAARDAKAQCVGIAGPLWAGYRGAYTAGPVEQRLQRRGVRAPGKLRDQEAEQNVVGIGVDPACVVLKDCSHGAVAAHELVAPLGHCLGLGIGQVFGQPTGVAQQGEHRALRPGSRHIGKVATNRRFQIQCAGLRQIQHGAGGDMLSQGRDRKPGAAGHGAFGTCDFDAGGEDAPTPGRQQAHCQAGNPEFARTLGQGCGQSCGQR